LRKNVRCASGSAPARATHCAAIARERSETAAGLPPSSARQSSSVEGAAVELGAALLLVAGCAEAALGVEEPNPNELGPEDPGAEDPAPELDPSQAATSSSAPATLIDIRSSTTTPPSRERPAHGTSAPDLNGLGHRQIKRLNRPQKADAANFARLIRAKTP